MNDTRPDKLTGPTPAEPKRPGGSLIPVLTVLGFVLAVIVVLVGFTGPAGLYVVLAISGVFGFAALHYLLWGWWLMRRLRDANEGERADTDD